MNSIKVYGNKRLSGSVKISGAKNSALPIIAASIINRGKVTLENVPNITDVIEMLEILTQLNVKYSFENNVLKIDSTNITYCDLLSSSVKKIRASYYFIGAMISCFNMVKITTPGGCSIGSRPIDFHIKIIEQLGASYSFDNDILSMQIENYEQLDYTFKKKSVGATINALLASVNSNKKIILRNVSIEPEVIDVINFLNIMGCRIKIRKNKYICLPKKNINNDVRYKVIPDRIEAATYITLGLLTGEIEVLNANPRHLNNVIKPLIKNGAKLIVDKNSIIAKQSKIKAFDITTGEYPSFSTDIQPIITVLLSVSNGKCLVKDSIFTDRFKSCYMLEKMGSKIAVNEDEINIIGVSNLYGREVSATDLRAAAALLLAALTASGITTINNIDYIHRGYANVFNNLKKLGAIIKF